MKKTLKTLEDSLVDVIIGGINKQKKDQTIAYKLTDADSPTNVDMWIPTGATFLDLAVSNRPYGGLPVGRIVELTGLEAAGKSLLAAHIIAETQKLGGIGVLLDTEIAVSSEFFEAIGIDLDKLVYVNPDTVEDIFENIEYIIEKIRTSDHNLPVTIVVDSLAAVSTKSELDGNFEKGGYATDKAIIISKAMRKITSMIGRQNILLVFTNQLRYKMNAMPFSDPYQTSGGKAVDYHSSVRIRLKPLGNIKTKTEHGDRVVGLKVRGEVLKNRVGPPKRTADFDIYFDRGIDNYSAWLTYMKDFKMVKQGGAWYEYTDEVTTTTHKFQAKDFQKLLTDNPELKEQIYKKICDAQILIYKTRESSLDVDVLSVEYSNDDE